MSVSNGGPTKCERCEKEPAVAMRFVVRGNPGDSDVSLMLLCKKCEKIVWKELSETVDEV